MKDNRWARILAYVTGLVNQELLLRNEYLAPENPYHARIYRRGRGSPIRRGRHSLRSANDSVARR
jgi:hypothetical protein